MRKARIAESILSRLTTRDIAASMVGDWMEEVPVRGTLWFWCCVLGTAGGFAWRKIFFRPFYVVGLAFVAWVLSNLLFWGTYALVGCAALIPMEVMSLLRPEQTIALPGWTPLAISCGVNFQIGRWIARRAEGYALAVCLVYYITDTAVWILRNAQSQRTTGFQEGLKFPTYLFSRPSDWLPNFLTFACLIAGAVWVRRRESVAARVI